tara:strand:+ start:1005 stop:2216 length:1212 start_codon:yes stop_codon:yes gene_type:complete
MDSLPDVTDKIIEANYWFNLYGRRYKNTQDHLKICYGTLKKYIIIGGKLDFTLLDLLNKKWKRDKMTLDFAIKFIDLVKNPDHQIEIYSKIKDINKKDRIKKVEELIECPICCCESEYQESFRCCNTFICIDCIYKHLDLTINDLKFEGLKCPVCCEYLLKEDIYHLFNNTKRTEKTFWFSETHHSRDARKYRNLYLKYHYMIKAIEELNGKRINRRTMDFKELTSDNDPPLYYGVCQYCCPITDNYRHNFSNIQIKTVEKRCVENENIITLTKDMFKCQKCEDKDKIVFKKCPHCGIKTIKPDGCNFVVCGDHRWCFLCNERLPNNHEGHNVHYWMGPGTGPYSDNCRTLANYEEPDFVLTSCDCLHCSRREGSPLCRSLECYNRCPQIDEYEFNTYCGKCD